MAVLEDVHSGNTIRTLASPAATLRVRSFHMMEMAYAVRQMRRVAQISQLRPTCTRLVIADASR